MASLVRLRTWTHRRIVSINSLVKRRVLNRLIKAHQFARNIQTSADTTELRESPSDPSQPFTVKIHEDSFRSYKCDVPDLDVQVTKAQLLKMYQQMQTMRRMEMAADALYKAKLIRGFCHLAIGQVRHFRFTLTLCG
jgi:pyruvate dehydrogenase E1 component alpha subunit